MHKPRILCTLAALLVLCAALALPVSAGQPGGMEAPEDLAQKSVGVVTGAIYDQVLTARVPDARVNYFNNHTDEVAALLAGKIDALVTDEPMARYIVSQSPGLRILPEMFQQDSYAFAFPQDRAALRDEVNGALEQLRADGTLQQIDARWFGADEAAKVLPQFDLPAERGTLRFATVATSAPFSYLKDGQIVGYDIEIAMRVCRELGYALEITDMDFGGIIPGINAGKYDMAGACITVTEERKQSVLFSDPDYTGGIAAVVRDETAAGAAGLPALDELNGKKLGVNTGSVFDQVILARLPDAQVNYFNNLPDETAALLAGKIDAVVTDQPMARYVVSQNEGLAILPEMFREDSYAFAFPLDHTGLQAQVNEALAKLQADGVLAQADEKWFGGNEAAQVLPELELTGENGTLRFATTGSSAPFSFMKDGQVVGYDVELALRICAELGYKLEIATMDFGGIIPGLTSGKYDMAGACITVTEERKGSVLFSDPDYTGGIVAIVRAESGAASAGLWQRIQSGFYKTFLLENRWQLFVQGLGVTILISLLSAVFGTVLGFGVCMARRSRHRLASAPARVFVRLVQGVPVLVFLMILFYLVFTGVDNGIVVAVAGFSINFAAYVSEMMRTAIDTVDPGQLEAAAALGFNRVRAFCKITAPQAIRYILPVYRGEFISMVKMTSIVGYITIQDLTRMSDIVRGLTYDAFFSLISTAVIYFALANLLAAALSLLEARVDPKQRKRKVKGVVMQ
ncbi:ABC transporter permease subunit [Allofournierella sp.]|uniref:ABC transporter permease subunit n=1 Tax=Allofournierella sp. TaxID=1940256 RepID=UPI003AF186E4